MRVAVTSVRDFDDVSGFDGDAGLLADEFNSFSGDAKVLVGEDDLERCFGLAFVDLWSDPSTRTSGDDCGMK